MTSSSEITNITMNLIKTATENFSKEKKIGSGGYGEVYKGVLNGEEIAVKKLFFVPDLDDKEFENEFNSLMNVKHKNVIRLIRYCYEIAHTHTQHNGKFRFAEVVDRALCFEYMQEGSLAKHISANSCIHGWPTTYKIIKGICEGIHYLHKERGEKNRIYHLDLKPENILLDNNMVPKIGDFGLSKLFGDSRTHQTSTMKGTIGFMPPEFIHNRIVSKKNDVFSLGVIIFHIMVGQNGYNNYCDSRLHKDFSEKKRQEFIESVQEYWKTKMQATLDYKWDETDLSGVKKCIEIAIRCVETDRNERPTTEMIIRELNELDVQIEEVLREDPKLLGKEKISGSNKDIIALDPSMELRFPFKPKREMSSCLEIKNKSESSIAFYIKIDQNKYCAQPNKGVISPFSRRYITITAPAQDKAPVSLDMFIVLGISVAQDFTSDMITEDFLKNNATAADEVTLPIVYV